MSGVRRCKIMRGKEKVDLGEESLEMANQHSETIDYGIILPYDVVSMIFKRLFARDLSNCAMVCRLWQEVAVNELASRGPMIDFLPSKAAFKACHTSVFSHNLTNRPMLGLLFSKINSYPGDCFNTHFPRNCLSILMKTSGVVVNEKEFDRYTPVAVCGYLPESSEVEIEYLMSKKGQIIHLNKNLEALSNGLHGQQPQRWSVIEPMIRGAVHRMKEIKCMLLITSERFGHENKLCSLEVINENVPILWGGITKELRIGRRGEAVGTCHAWIAVLIGGPNVKSWSLIIGNGVRRKEEVREKFIEWRKDIQPMKHTVALMFACVGRGTYMYGVRDVEASSFKEIFPDIPLVGGFGNGEFGFNVNNKSERQACHQYSSSFLILTYD
ncbi:uncharacterized protein [Fopius arisanus]|uniref:FBXO22_0 protein n=1 Tax=Fopius arisanus TaxID=64838 RepID=A0A0C9Q6V8_9HYME|nr:PREDICTED: uncharacterized protein LOC105269278 [Fopius arisanus]